MDDDLMREVSDEIAALEARATAAEAENARLRKFVAMFAVQPCSCGVMHNAVLCAPCRARAALEENQNVG
jgi:hypothetical protein